LKSTKTYSLAGLLLIFSGILLFGGCSTKKNSFIRRTYHNTTSHYNVYWNGMDNMRQGVKEYRLGIKDNYALILPVYNYGDRASAAKISQFADASIKKASKAINKHSMVFNRKEHVRWIDDSYLLIGMGYFYKQDYPMARRTFEFVIKTYNENDIKYEAMLWLARSNIQLGDYNRAEPMLDMLLSKIAKGEAPDSYEPEVNLSYAQFYILQQNYDAAVPYLNRAMELKLPRAMRTRCSFILGQIYQKNGEFEEASRSYAYVVKTASTYDMEFNAKINLAQCYDAGSGDREFIVKKLMRMIKEEKNKDFLDQIYYALAHISMKDSDTLTAIGYLKQSVTTSLTNNYQKAISSLELANIFFDNHNYPLAQSYYDSTMQFLPKEYPGYTELMKRTHVLTDLVDNLQTISKQDSLQRLALLSEEERNRIIDQIIGNLIAEESLKKQQEQARQDNLNLFGQNRESGSGGGTTTAGRWYFYNPTTMSSGFSTFMRKWGSRKSEDNWFLTDKMATVNIETEEITDSISAMPGDTATGGKIAMTTSNNPKERAYYLPDIPFSKEQVAASNNKIIEAYYNAGFIYAEGLMNYGSAIGCFENLLERFPDNKYKVQSYYELYQLFKILENQPKSDQYKNLVLSQYPDSDYARLLVNPNYYQEINDRQSDAARLYNDTYQAFTNQQFYMVINNADQARASFRSDSILMPKFDYLRALAIGKIEIVDSMVVAISKVIKDYPKSEIKPLAENVLAFLGTQKDSKGMPIETDSTAIEDLTEKLYKYDPEAVHFYVLIVNGNLVDVNALKIKISDHNARFHDLDDLMVNSLILDDTQEMITVNNFSNSKKAMDYLLGIRDSKYIFTRLENTGMYYDFIISAENYPVFYRNKDISQYIRFFEKYYPVQE